MAAITRRSIAPRTVSVPLSAGSGAASSPELAGSPGVVSIVASREWVLPPRPKPGRKPNADTPELKHKARNRAAQRAFRERRATRVQELEQKLLEVEKENEEKEISLINTISKLKFENQFLVKSMNQLHLEFASLKSSISAQGLSSAVKGSVLSAASPEVAPHKGKIELLQTDPVVNQTAQSLLSFAKALPATQPGGTPNLQPQVCSVQQMLPASSVDSPSVFVSKGHSNLVHPQNMAVPTKDSHDFDCGICTKDLCLCEDAGLKTAPPSAGQTVEETYKTFTPIAAVSLKRKKPVQEKDFTQLFTVKKMPELKRFCSQKQAGVLDVKKKPAEISFNENSPVENCGFCSDDSPCVCREAAQEAARLRQSLSDKFLETAIDEADDDSQSTALPPLYLNENNMARKTSLPVLHPGPSLEISEFSNPAAHSATPLTAEPSDEKEGCTGNPGMCPQCQLDPMSTLFCTTVARKAAEENPDNTKRAGSQTPAQTDRKILLTPQLQPLAGNTSIFIPCADAYRTLSRHKRFNSVDFSSLVGRLTTRGMQVEVQSVANIIRELDRKVYD